jgi:uncharacterized membrane protein YidH (DUF202 family)
VVDPRVYLAIERTLLAWIRTSVAFLAFGLAIEKLDFFLKYMLPSREVFQKPLSLQHPLLDILGKILIALGILTLILGKLNFYLTLRRVEKATYRTAVWLYFIYFLILLLIGLSLFFYLIYSR